MVAYELLNRKVFKFNTTNIYKTLFDRNIKRLFKELI
jgi:hypothetical protein